MRTAVLKREPSGRVPFHVSIAYMLTGFLVFFACIAGNTPPWRLKLSLVLIEVAILIGWAKLLSAGASAAPVTGQREIQAWMVGAMAALILVHCGVAWRFVDNTSQWTDCFTFQRDAVVDLLHGVDPYGRTRPNIYNAQQTAQFYTPETESGGRVQVGMQYPPITFLCALPGYLMGDLRYGYVAAIALSALFLFAAMPDGRGLALTIILLYNPITFFVEAFSWTEPLVWMLLCATLYTALKRPKLLPLALGLFLASKQYNLIALPLLGYWLRDFEWRAYWRLVAGSLAVAAATVLPFALWNFRALWHDLVWFHLAQPVRHDELGFAAIFPLAMKFGPLLALAFIASALLRGARRPELFPAAYAMAMLIFVSTSKQAFLNYYFLIAQSLLLTGVVLWPERRADVPKQAEPASL